MLNECLSLFGTKLTIATGTVETDFAIEMYFLSPTSGATYILIVRLSHLTSLSLLNASHRLQMSYRLISDGNAIMAAFPRQKYVVTTIDRLFIRRHALGSRLPGYTHNG
jgi:hypothetical protein